MTTMRFLLILLLAPLTGSCEWAPSDHVVWETMEQAGNRSSRSRPHSRRKSKKVVIDAGHGGGDYGTYSIEKPRYHEKFLTLATAMMVRDQLHKMGYQVYMTRSRDNFVDLNKRAEMANKRKSDLFVSIHYNSAPSRKAHGVEIFFYDSRKDTKRATQSKQFALKVLDHVVRTSKAASRGVKAGNFAVIRNTDMPAILIEGGFLTNAVEMRRLKDPKALNKVAWGIAKGIDEFLIGG